MSLPTTSLFLTFLAFILPLSLSILGYGFYLRLGNRSRRATVLSKLKRGSDSKARIVGFFHPYCNAGGGGERVLWTAIASIQRSHPQVICTVYTGDVDATKEGIIAKVKARFDISLDPSSLHFVFLHSRRWVEDDAWPRFTLLGQSIGSMYLVWEAMSLLIPDLFIDTMGYAFTFHVVACLAKIPIGAYVHYPTISTDMLARVKERKKWHTNAGDVSSSVLKTRLKLLYYRLFMYYYSVSLRQASFLMVNSTWTKEHVDSILQHTDPLLDALHLPLYPLSFFLQSKYQREATLKTAKIVYPPCDTSELVTFPIERRKRIILSVAQFRPEKDHAAQLDAFAFFRKSYAIGKDVKLVLVGGSRNDGDAQRVANLRKQAQGLGVEDAVEFVLNAPYSAVLDWLSKASVGLSTMVDEHFGINVVEFMAAGVIPVAHASGGPLKDIIRPVDGKPTGFHATDTNGFAAAFEKVFVLPPEEDSAIRRRGRDWAVQTFSVSEFEKGWDQGGWLDWI